MQALGQRGVGKMGFGVKGGKRKTLLGQRGVGIVAVARAVNESSQPRNVLP